MKDWLRFFGLSFFSDNIAKEAKVRGVMNCVLGFVLALIFIFCGVLASNSVPFYMHYNGATDFKAVVRGLTEEGFLSVKGGLLSSDKIIDTYASESDAAKYGASGYNVVVDTRSSKALDDFEAYCLSKDGKTEIEYAAYRELPDEEKSNYTFKIRYTPNELILTDALVEEYGKYLTECGGEAASQYAEITARKDDVTAEEYNNGVYALYIKYYYPDISAFERLGDVPLLRSYYYLNYLNGKVADKGIYIFDDVLFGYFVTDGGISVNFYGSYRNMDDGALTADNADAFVKNAFGSTLSATATVYLMNVIRFIPFIAVIPLILALVAKLVLTYLKDEKYKKYTTCLKIEFSYIAVAALITALVVFICGFFLAGTALNILPLLILSAVMLGRTVALLIGEYLRIKKEKSIENPTE